MIVKCKHGVEVGMKLEGPRVDFQTENIRFKLTETYCRKCLAEGVGPFIIIDRERNESMP